MTTDERERALALRKARHLPWHSPPHLNFVLAKQYLVSASCHNHACVIGKSPERMTDWESNVLTLCQEYCSRLYAWCVLPNHYHALLKTERIAELIEQLGELHGRSSFVWNGEDNRRGRKVWYNCFERSMKSERHFWATLNYVHNNAVHHGWVDRWQDWPWSSARNFLSEFGYQKARDIWLRYPVLNYGKKWDI